MHYETHERETSEEAHNLAFSRILANGGPHTVILPNQKLIVTAEFAIMSRLRRKGWMMERLPYSLDGVAKLYFMRWPKDTDLDDVLRAIDPERPRPASPPYPRSYA